MKFYLCNPEGAAVTLRTSKTEADKLDKNAEQVDVPTDQAGLQSFFQQFFDEIHRLNTELNKLKLLKPLHLDPVTGSTDPIVVDTDEQQQKAIAIAEAMELEESPYWPFRNYADFTTWFEDRYRELPVPHQLALNQGTMEIVREVFPHKAKEVS